MKKACDSETEAQAFSRDVTRSKKKSRACDNSPNSCNTDKNDGFDRDVKDMTSNYMDYEDTACQHDFTEGQTERMRYNIEQFRSSLLTSPACTASCSTPISALFEQSQERKGR